MADYIEILTSKRYLLGLALICGLVGIAWLLVLLQEAATRKIRSLDKRKLIDGISNTATQRFQTAQAQANEYRPVATRVANQIGTWLAPHFSFRGNATRKQFLVTQVIVGLALGVVFGIGGWMYESRIGPISFLGALLVFAALCAACWLLWAVSARRTRDTGVIVWWVLTLLIPPLNLATFVFLLLVPTDEFRGKGL